MSYKGNVLPVVMTLEEYEEISDTSFNIFVTLAIWKRMLDTFAFLHRLNNVRGSSVQVSIVAFAQPCVGNNVVQSLSCQCCRIVSAYEIGAKHNIKFRVFGQLFQID